MMLVLTSPLAPESQYFGMNYRRAEFRIRISWPKLTDR